MGNHPSKRYSAKITAGNAISRHSFRKYRTSFRKKVILAKKIAALCCRASNVSLFATFSLSLRCITNVLEGMLTVRVAAAEDRALIHEMAAKVFPLTYKDILTPEQNAYMMEWMYSLENLRKQMEEEGHVYLIGYDDDKPMGYVSVQREGEDLFHLQKIYVLPEFQGKHCGSFLFREAEKLIKSLHPGPCAMELNVNRHNKALLFYERMGMHKVREGDFPIGNGFYMNDYIMGKEL